MTKDMNELNNKIDEFLKPYADMDEYGGADLIWTGEFHITNGAEFISELKAHVAEQVRLGSSGMLSKIITRMGNKQGEIMLHGPDGRAGWEAPEVAYIMGYNQARRDFKRIISSEKAQLKDSTLLEGEK